MNFVLFSWILPAILTQLKAKYFLIAFWQTSNDGIMNGFTRFCLLISKQAFMKVASFDMNNLNNIIANSNSIEIHQVDRIKMFPPCKVYIEQ